MVAELEEWLNSEMTRIYLEELDQGIEEWLGIPLGIEVPWTCKCGVWKQW